MCTVSGTITVPTAGGGAINETFTSRSSVPAAGDVAAADGGDPPRCAADAGDPRCADGAAMTARAMAMGSTVEETVTIDTSAFCRNLPGPFACGYALSARRRAGADRAGSA